MKKYIKVFIITIIIIIFIFVVLIINKRKDKDNMESIKVTINDKDYYLNLTNNETTKAFLKYLPQEFNMKELNGNEKYIYMDYTLPTNEKSIKHIEKGDVMLYGDNCLVIFYESFDTTYSYTLIGHIDNLPNLGSGNITVKFEK